jgi:hypothetical protein
MLLGRAASDTHSVVDLLMVSVFGMWGVLPSLAGWSPHQHKAPP